MDIASILVSFLVGCFTGAASTYLGQKFTDERRRKEEISRLDKEWRKIENKYPEIIKEMKEDINHPDYVGVRTLFVCESTNNVGAPGPIFTYYTDKHPDLVAAISVLEDLGYLENTTTGNLPKYRMKEIFIERLKNA